MNLLEIVTIVNVVLFAGLLITNARVNNTLTHIKNLKDELTYQKNRVTRNVYRIDELYATKANKVKDR